MSGFSTTRRIKNENSAPVGSANDGYKSEEDALADARGHQAAKKYELAIECYDIYFRRLGNYKERRLNRRTSAMLLKALHGRSVTHYDFAIAKLDIGKTPDDAEVKQHIEYALGWAEEYNQNEIIQEKRFNLSHIRSLGGRIERKSIIVPEEHKDYSPNMPAVELENALRTLAMLLGRPVATIRAQLGLADAGHEVTAPARPTAPIPQPSLAKPRRGLPTLPPGLSWPTETYSGSPESKRGGGGIVAYLERVWLPLFQTASGVISLPILRTIDPSAAFGINNYTRNGRSLPPHLDIPTKKTVNDRLLSQGHRVILNDPRLARVVADRIRHGRTVPGF